MISYIVIIAIYIVLSVLGFKLYFFLQNKNLDTKSKLKKVVASYTLFILFIFIEIPFAIFFPAWLNAKLNVFNQSSNYTMYLLLFGTLVLCFSIWYARNDRPKLF